ncbi:hypothetical protein [Hymenobacter sp. BT559]|uniref:hypothetical protein n=1 Tax=Hymenobacter sp. BT559 TaxID=2795729 RepID=UPI0018EDEFFE|nr:hypothetical protein [Hymenobacter sp. BT559]MBJ6145940.1 hypothetical protein [Hymenobacter sp. BT559]
MKYNFYVLLASVSLLTGCGKDRETQPALVGSFEAEAVIKPAPIMMYTSTGMVDNQMLVDKFLARRNRNAGTYFSRVEVPLPTTQSLILAFRGNNRVTLLDKGPTRTDSIQTDVTSQSSQRLVLAQKDSVVILQGSSTDRAEQLSGMMQLEQPGQRCQILPPSSGIPSLYCRVRTIRVITRHNGQLFLPQLSWLIQTSTAYATSYWAYKGVQNTFNSAVINQLVAGDTLVVQAREIPFLKK